jgi:hypothetical protein
MLARPSSMLLSRIGTQSTFPNQGKLPLKSSASLTTYRSQIPSNYLGFLIDSTLDTFQPFLQLKAPLDSLAFDHTRLCWADNIGTWRKWQFTKPRRFPMLAFSTILIQPLIWSKEKNYINLTSNMLNHYETLSKCHSWGGSKCEM